MLLFYTHIACHSYLKKNYLLEQVTKFKISLDIFFKFESLTLSPKEVGPINSLTFLVVIVITELFRFLNTNPSSLFAKLLEH